MKIFRLVVLLLLVTMTVQAQENKAPQWNGYIQTRFSSNLNTTSGFMVRRAKLWLKGDVPTVNFISYKLQVVYRSYKDQNFIFQDALADIHLKDNGLFRLGRFVPYFMLQRMQPDYQVPVLERASVINALNLNPKYGARMIGLEYLYSQSGQPWHASIGLFNGNTDKPGHNNNSLLVTSRLNRKFRFDRQSDITLGGSVAYRNITQMSLPTIYAADSLLSGDDFRWGAEALLHCNHFQLQAEYIQALLNSGKADGYYLLGWYDFNTHYQLTAFTEKYTDLNSATSDQPWYGLGFNYLITEKTKLMADFKCRDLNQDPVYSANIQLQLLFR
ncbi:porin [Prolixibacter sp. SD074]|uniref:porin n=1 Tax=Prolixibacter sp. SD074 TaxID=2652391 RepID=UPI00188DE22D|nr:porin [Prolixibacter sp. SD074]